MRKVNKQIMVHSVDNVCNLYRFELNKCHVMGKKSESNPDEYGYLSLQIDIKDPDSDLSWVGAFIIRPDEGRVVPFIYVVKDGKLYSKKSTPDKEFIDNEYLIDEIILQLHHYGVQNIYPHDQH